MRPEDAINHGYSNHVVFVDKDRDLVIWEIGHDNLKIAARRMLHPRIDGGVSVPLDSIGSTKVARFFFCMGYNKEKIEQDFRVTITAAEQLEWAMQMKDAGFPLDQKENQT